jgi:hypothetical protein
LGVIGSLIRSTTVPRGDAVEYVAVAELTGEDVPALLRRQVARFHAYALALAHRSGLTCGEAAELFLSAKPEAARGPKVRTASELESVVMEMAAGAAAARGGVNLGHDAQGWVLAESVSELVEELAGWSVPVDYLEAWFEAVQALEAADLGLDWTVRLVDGHLTQRLQLPHRREPTS